jgi:hypothetical protein
MLHVIVDCGVIMNNGIMNVPLNSNVCSTCGREILFSPLREFVVLRNPVPPIGTYSCDEFYSSCHVCQMYELIQSLEQNHTGSNLFTFFGTRRFITMVAIYHAGHMPVLHESSAHPCTFFLGFIPLPVPRFIK